MVERVPAVISDIGRIKSAAYVEMPGWEPNYVVIDERVRASRLNVIGVITLSEPIGSGIRYTLTDVTGEIALQSFERSEPEALPGDLVVVIGRPRTFQNEIYLVPEIIRRLDMKWAGYRKRQLELLEKERAPLERIPIEKPVASAQRTNHPPTLDRSEPSAEKNAPIPQSATATERIYAMIESLDPGDGVALTDVLEKAQAEGIENAERAITHMLEMGDIFEIRAGRLKVL
jgi:hypothetical protein